MATDADLATRMAQFIADVSELQRQQTSALTEAVRQLHIPQERKPPYPLFFGKTSENVLH